MQRVEGGSEAERGGGGGAHFGELDSSVRHGDGGAFLFGNSEDMQASCHGQL